MESKRRRNWQKIYHATLYKFSKPAYTKVVEQFSRSPIPVSRVCAYSEADDIFEISCPKGEREMCLKYLLESIHKYIEGEELNRTLNARFIPTITPIPESIVVKAHIDAGDEDEWDLTRDIGSNSQSSDDNLMDEPMDTVEPTEEEMSLSWTPEAGVQLQDMVTRETLDELEKLSGCKLRLDDTAENVLIFSDDNHLVDRLWDRLGVIQNAFRRKAIVTHVIRVEGRPKFKFIGLSNVSGGALGRVLLPPHSVNESDWNLDERLVLCSLRFDNETQAYQIQKRSNKDIVPSVEEASVDIWHKVYLRNIGAGVVSYASPFAATVPTSQTQEYQEDALSRDVQQWMSTVEPALNYQAAETPEFSLKETGSPKDLKTPLEDIEDKSVGMGKTSESETATQMQSSKPYPWLKEQSESKTTSKDLGPWAKTDKSMVDHSANTSGIEAKENAKPFSIANPWVVEQKLEDAPDPSTATEGGTTWQQVLGRPQRGGPFRNNRSYRSTDSRGRGHIEPNRATSKGRRGDSLRRSSNFYIGNPPNASQRGANPNNRRNQTQQSSSRPQQRGSSIGRRRSRSSTARGSPSRHIPNNAFELISLDDDEQQDGESSTTIQPAPGFGAQFTIDTHDGESQAEVSAVMTDELIDLSEPVEESQASPSTPWEPTMQNITPMVYMSDQVIERLASDDDEVSTRILRHTVRHRKPPPKPSSKSAQPLAALNSLKEDYYKANPPIIPKPSSNRLSEIDSSTPTTTKLPKQSKSVQIGPMKDEPHPLTDTVKKALLNGKSFRGKLNLEMQIGQILTLDQDMQDFLIKDFDDVTDLLSLFVARSPASFETMHAVFTGSITSGGSDTETLLSLLHLDPTPTSADTWWEFHCTEPSQKEVIIHVNAEDSGAEPFVTAEEELLGACYFHFPDRVWDARFIVCGSEHHTDLSAVDGAKDLVESLYFREQADGSNEGTSLLGRESSALNVSAVRLHRRLRYDVPSQLAGTSYYIQFTRVEEWLTQRLNNDQFARGAFRAFRRDDSQLIETQCLTYEVSLGQANAGYHDAFKANFALSLGDEAKWDVDELVNEEALRSLEELTVKVVGVMDPIGRRNKGPKAEEEKARKMKMKAVKEEQRKVEPATQWETLGHW